ncbi:DUF2516 family protein [Nesterenkonia halotolerans]|uniref:Uncharacterized membrane protein YgaE (UPF0421/DUF939 family) n=1 Tax=Nesterenkonia halotolerans TaxID=225325 RepID=A0ABR9J9C9_9MICC|nr:DUF2516 family protein [Nesterenkonia halotolerans]MBE1515617.1 uncharacterized membrane protein YgaE (UPF0421/DUF939 family) [Nesterenkonia halotolerans]
MASFSSIWLFVLQTEQLIQLAFAFGCLIVAVVALIKCIPKNAQRFDIAFKRTKGFWLGMTGGAVVLALLGALGSTPFGLIFPVAAACMAMVYLTDVNPAVSE